MAADLLSLSDDVTELSVEDNDGEKVVCLERFKRLSFLKVSCQRRYSSEVFTLGRWMRLEALSFRESNSLLIDDSVCRKIIQSCPNIRALEIGRLTSSGIKLLLDGLRNLVLLESKESDIDSFALERLLAPLHPHSSLRYLVLLDMGDLQSIEYQVRKRPSLTLVARNICYTTVADQFIMRHKTNGTSKEDKFKIVKSLSLGVECEQHFLG